MIFNKVQTQLTNYKYTHTSNVHTVLYTHTLFSYCTNVQINANLQENTPTDWFHKTSAPIMCGGNHIPTVGGGAVATGDVFGFLWPGVVILTADSFPPPPWMKGPPWTYTTPSPPHPHPPSPTHSLTHPCTETSVSLAMVVRVSSRTYGLCYGNVWAQTARIPPL